jgi:hypothetical protein
MRNLICIEHTQCGLDLPPEFGLARWLAIGAESGDVYVAGDGLQIACHTRGADQVGAPRSQACLFFGSTRLCFLPIRAPA